MSDTTVVETIFGKYGAYEIVKKTPVLGSPEFYVHKDGKPHRGSFSSLRAAVEAAEAEG